MERALRWAIASVGSVLVFLAAWLLLEFVGRQDRGLALTFAGVLFAVVAAPLSWWAGKEPRAAEPAGPRAVVGPPIQATTSSLKGVTRFFTGRASEVAVIEGALDSTADPRQPHATFIIHGMPGVGKTTLATYLANRLVARFRDQARPQILARQVDLRGLEELGPTDPKDALASLLSLDGIDRRSLPGDLEGLAARWREHTVGKLLILLLDNARDEKQVAPFLPGQSGHVVLVTSRRSLQGLVLSEGAIPVNLPVLTQKEAVGLIVARVARPVSESDRTAIEGIASFCGYHPQAITIVVVGMVNKPHISFAHRLKQLESMPNRLLAVDDYVDAESGRVATAFELSYTQLPDECQLVLRRLSVAPVPNINAEVAAALTGLPSERVRAHLRRLEAEGLIDDGAKGYHLHDLIRHYARGLADHDGPAPNSSAVEHVLAYYHDGATLVDAALTRQPPPPALPAPTPVVRHPFADLAAAIVWAQAELDNLLACADYVDREGTEQRPWVIRFAAALAGMLRNDGQWPRSVELQTRAITAARQLDLPLAEANALHERGQLRRLLGDLAHATEDLERALTIYQEIGGTEGATGEAHVLNTYAVVSDQRKLPGEARSRLSASLAVYRRLGNQLGEANVLHDQGMAGFFAGQYTEAAELLGQALALYQVVGHPLGQAHAHNNLAKIQLRTGRDREAAHSLESARALYHQLGNLLGEASTLTELGTMLRQRRDNDRAAEILTTAIDLNERIGNQLGLAKALLELGTLRGAMGDLTTAKDLLTRSLDVYRRHDIRRDESGPLNELRSLGLLEGE
jgi:tetratricopeptide (TPR) repeat protein